MYYIFWRYWISTIIIIFSTNLDAMLLWHFALSHLNWFDGDCYGTPFSIFFTRWLFCKMHSTEFNLNVDSAPSIDHSLLSQCFTKIIGNNLYCGENGKQTKLNLLFECKAGVLLVTNFFFSKHKLSSVTAIFTLAKI